MRNRERKMLKLVTNACSGSIGLHRERLLLKVQNSALIKLQVASVESPNIWTPTEISPSNVMKALTDKQEKVAFNRV